MGEKAPTFVWSDRKRGNPFLKNYLTCGTPWKLGGAKSENCFTRRVRRGLGKWRNGLGILEEKSLIPWEHSVPKE